jgi:hypothetical protein
MGDTATAVAAPQHLRALEHANRIRLARADLKRKVGAGRVSAAELISEPPPELGSMSISELLMSQRRWGRARCRRLLVSLGVQENKRIGTLTERQRSAVCALLSARANGHAGANGHGVNGHAGPNGDAGVSGRPLEAPSARREAVGAA